jgi:3-dehydroquinate synthase
VDSSIGGKVAVNLDAGKNLVGAFYHPALVVIDTDVLKTLADDDFAGGMAEAIKTGAICDAKLFGLIERNAGRKNVSSVIDKLVKRCCEIKADVVREDELDGGLRMILNFGHTLAHAIEKMPGNVFTHGQAVSIGMVRFAGLGESLGITQAGTSDRIVRIVKAFGLPTGIQGNKDKFIEIMKRDKKIREGILNVILLEKIGKAVVHKVQVDKIGELI